MAYSAYPFGVRPRHIPRSYLGDPAKFRLVHGGSKYFTPAIRTAERFVRPQAASHRRNASWHAAKNGPVKYPVIRTRSIAST